MTEGDGSCLGKDGFDTKGVVGDQRRDLGLVYSNGGSGGSWILILGMSASLGESRAGNGGWLEGATVRARGGYGRARKRGGGLSLWYDRTFCIFRVELVGFGKGGIGKIWDESLALQQEGVGFQFSVCWGWLLLAFIFGWNWGCEGEGEFDGGWRWVWGWRRWLAAPMYYV